MKIKFLLSILFFVNLLAKENVYFIVVAGGVGERLWPLSCQKYPKQFLSIDGEKTLLEMALERADGIVENGHKLVATTKDFVSLVQQQVGNQIEQILVEPALRNTGPAICLAAMKIAQKDPNAILVFLAADHFIHPVKNFKDSVKLAIDYAAKNDEMVLLGIKPTWPAIGYGYIKLSEKFVANKVMSVVSFHEKPSFEKAQEYLNMGTMVWNGSYFCARAKVFLSEFEEYAPQIIQGIKKYLAGEASYEVLPNISIDFAVMEKSKNLKAVLLDAQWSDVGNLAVFLTLRNQFEKSEKLIALNADNNLVFSKNNKQIVFLGVDDLCLVETDNVIVVAKKSSVEQIKKAVEILRTQRSFLV
ncbi:TPA: hypothetical protein DIC20_03800 [Candidatus Dependentiae bacterium]|nr:MAG: Mannose-1-phosphate guanylyltransferase/mannose-6-phosphate isomerase [candidate division TM6 bacterium GW2011_GWF2_36_131]KKQ03717.1 MAG: Mannose-1-phosphate guanylyltransferase/mannose-6-phosphate isomerase [candidate division TM6 bacterium GW2011_GWE2_36_25]KKQ20047.1 MAG: Mannose-1-phosphate guanylyltransferase/mannose-6-phosphate isomerase [candidate division TM6 bacterium GW2011_GWA2_36_9]HBR70484.1 hypothetical protein [Candidatus Dependentiae bacterium]HCU00800.1 hypothetical pr